MAATAGQCGPLTRRRTRKHRISTEVSEAKLAHKLLGRSHGAVTRTSVTVSLRVRQSQPQWGSASGSLVSAPNDGE